MRRQLPEPTWTPRPEFCLRCAYSLDGAARSGLCPECATPFDDQVLTLYGVPNTSRGVPIHRRIAWFVVLVGAAFYTQLWFVIVFFSPIIAAVGFLAIAAGATCLLITGRRERRGAERFILSSAGVARIPINLKGPVRHSDLLLPPFEGVRAIRIDRISPFWRRIRLAEFETPRGRLVNVIFDAGVRCADEYADAVADQLRAFLIPRSSAAPD